MLRGWKAGIANLVVGTVFLGCSKNMKRLYCIAATGLVLLAGITHLNAQTNTGRPVVEIPDLNGWTRLFDGKTLSGWTAPDAGNWEVKDGVVIGQGPTSHLFSPHTYTNLEFKSEVKLNHSGNSGMYIRAELG